ncbi:MAG TPA: tetratricopeptide repeat protein [Candidatus Angelobacter sp.]|jgi:tetratricopeptide (TPR) repeat protein
MPNRLGTQWEMMACHVKLIGRCGSENPYSQSCARIFYGPLLLKFFRQRTFEENRFKMSRHFGKAFFLLFIGYWGGLTLSAQQTKAAVPPAAGLSPEKAVASAEQGHCRENISALKRAMAAQVPAATRKQAGVVGVRCALAIDDRDAALEFIRLLNKQFARDADVLFVVVHAYSDLSTRTAQDLGRTAPQSLAAHKLNAEALEEQGKWEPALLEYEEMIRKEPGARGTHFLLGRLLLSRPDAGPDATQRAKQEFLKELQIDPTNSGAEYILGELARREENWDEATSRFSAAAKLNPNFAEAYLGWGVSLIGSKSYQQAIAPLRIAERLTPQNPDIHQALGTALVRSGQKEEANKEFAIHRSLSSTAPNAPNPEKPE